MRDQLERKKWIFDRVQQIFVVKDGIEGSTGNPNLPVKFLLAVSRCFLYTKGFLVQHNAITLLNNIQRNHKIVYVIVFKRSVQFFSNSEYGAVCTNTRGNMTFEILDDVFQLCIETG